jgi:GNAT superfamily N-acetyltransferase
VGDPSTAAPVSVAPATTRAEMREFLRYPYERYRGHPNWVPPLMMDQAKLFDRKRNPFFEHADAEFYLARRGGKVVGRICAIDNRLFDEYHGLKRGYFGFFEAAPGDEEAAHALLGAAEAWLAARGKTEVYGPENYSPNDDLGLLLDAYDRDPVLMMPYNGPEYPGFVESAGYAKAKDVYAWYLHKDSYATVQRILGIAERQAARLRIGLRQLEMRNLKREVQIIKELYNAVEKDANGEFFCPLTDAEIDALAGALAPIAWPELVTFAELDGRVVGFCLAVPDFNSILKKVRGRLFPTGIFHLLLGKRRITRLRVLVVGVLAEYRGKGIDALLYAQTWKNGIASGIVDGEFSWTLEDNVRINSGMEAVGARIYKRYRVYRKDLTPAAA